MRIEPCQTLKYSLVVCLFLMTGCASNEIQAPYDSFVCFKSTFNHCLDGAQSGQLIKLHTNLKTAAVNKPFGAAFKPFATGGGGIVTDPDAGKVVSTKDAKYQCQYGTIAYTQTLQPDLIAPAVFVSPILLRQIGEQQVKLGKIRTACARLVQAYDHQQDIQAAQDRLSTNQRAITMLSAETEFERLTKDAFGARPLTAAELVLYGVTGGGVRDALRTSRENSVTVGEQLRAMYKTQVNDIEYKKQFEDAALSIDLQLRELARSLFLLDRSIAPASPQQLTRQGYEDGAWVKQGTVVLATPGWRRE